ncbi:MAG TPA: type II secretion system F family protein [Epulopiscium sp.]|nr:type II secretion system F family protein [Candidatus Epulonipiscium sp.]
MVPLSVAKKTAMTTDLKDIPLFQPKIKTQDIAFLCKQFAVMIEAGISIGGALQILGEQAQNRTLQKKIQQINKDVQKGSNLSDAMARHKEFPDLLINMIKSGEASGFLNQVMKKMAIHYEKQMNLKRLLKKAMTYPILVLITVSIVIPVLMVFVIPGFVEIFQDTEIPLPMATQIIILISEWMQVNWAMMLMGMAFIIIGLIFFKQSARGKIFFNKMFLWIPIVGSLNKKTITALFSETLALLVTAGVPVFQSLEIVKDVLSNSVVKAEMEITLKDVREGRTISSSLEMSKIYPSMMISMLRIGEETGALDEMLGKTAEYYNLEVETAIEQLTVLIEPILMFIIAFLVGGIMIAVILPTFTLATEIM